MKNNVISPLNSQLLTKIIFDTMNKYVFVVIDDCIKNNNNNNNSKWTMRKECNYIAFSSIFGSIFGIKIHVLLVKFFWNS